MFEDIAPTRSEATYAPVVPAHVSPGMIARIIEDFADGFGIVNMWVTSVTTGHGRYTAHHFDDSDYIVTLAVIYSDAPWRTYEAVYGILGSNISCWAN